MVLSCFYLCLVNRVREKLVQMSKKQALSVKSFVPLSLQCFCDFFSAPFVSGSHFYNASLSLYAETLAALLPLGHVLPRAVLRGGLGLGNG